MAATIALAEAKAGLSSVVKRVSDTGCEYIVTVRGVPRAMIVPIPKTSAKACKAKGMLAGKHPPVSRAEEKAAYARALEATYANLA